MNTDLHILTKEEHTYVRACTQTHTPSLRTDSCHFPSGSHTATALLPVLTVLTSCVFPVFLEQPALLCLLPVMISHSVTQESKNMSSNISWQHCLWRGVQNYEGRLNISSHHFSLFFLVTTFCFIVSLFSKKKTFPLKEEYVSRYKGPGILFKIPESVLIPGLFVVSVHFTRQVQINLRLTIRYDLNS